MFDKIQKHIKTNIAQDTQLFDVDTQNISADTQNNRVFNTGLDGEYTLSDSVDGVASKCCINQTFVFENGEVVTDCYFGDEIVTHKLTAHKVNVGSAITRELALQMMLDEKTGNCIIVYLNGTHNISTKEKYTVSEDLSIKVKYSLGVLVKVNAKQMQKIGCTNTDIVFINSVLGIKKDTSSMIQFESVSDRFFAGEFYCLDLNFSYIDLMVYDDIIKSRLKHFDANLEIKI